MSRLSASVLTWILVAVLVAGLAFGGALAAEGPPVAGPPGSDPAAESHTSWSPPATDSKPGTGVEHKVLLTDAPPYVNPLHLEIQVGDTVVFENFGPEEIHSVTDEAAMYFAADLQIDESFGYQFDRAGAYPFVCFRHHFMKGTITVRNADGTLEAEPDYPYQRAFTEYAIPTRDSVPRMIIASKVDDSIWFTEGGGGFYIFEDYKPMNKLGQLRPDGSIIELATPTPDGDWSKVGVDSLVMDDDGVIWFTERLTNRIGKLGLDGKIEEFQIPTEDGYALGIDLAPDGKIWFAERFGHRLGWMTPDGEMTELALPEGEAEPRTVFVDSKGRVWYTARSANTIGYLEPDSGDIRSYKIPTELARPTGIAETSDGSIYFVEMVGNKIARIQGDQITEFPIPTQYSAPFKIVADAHDNLWFTQVFGNSIGKLDPRTGKISEYKIPTPDSRPGGIAIDRKGRIWFTEQAGNKIGVFDPQAAEQWMAAAEKQTEQETLAHSHGSEPSAPASGSGVDHGTQHGSSPAAAPAPAAASPRPVSPPGPGDGSDEGSAPNGGSAPKDASPKRVTPSDGSSSGLVRLGDDYRARHFDLPHPGSGPGNDIVEDADGWLWFNQIYGNRVGGLNLASGESRSIDLPSPFSMPVGLVLDGHGFLWVTEFRGNNLAKVDTRDGTVIEYPVPTDAALPSGITLGADGDIWFTELGANAVARFDPKTETFEEIPLPVSNGSPLMIATDESGDLWVTLTEERGNYLALHRLADARFELYPIPTPEASPIGLLVDGRSVWVAEGGVGQLARFDRDRQSFEEFVIPAERAEPVKLAKGRDGRIWLTDGGGLAGNGGNRLVVFDPKTRDFELIPMDVAAAKPRGIIAASDGHIWFSQQNANRISQLLPQGGAYGEITQ